MSAAVKVRQFRGNVNHYSNIDIKKAVDEDLVVSATSIGRIKTKFVYKDPIKPRNLNDEFLKKLVCDPNYEEQRQVLKKVTKARMGKGGTDTSAPTSFKLRRAASAAVKLDSHAAIEH